MLILCFLCTERRVSFDDKLVASTAGRDCINLLFPAYGLSSTAGCRNDPSGRQQTPKERPIRIPKSVADEVGLSTLHFFAIWAQIFIFDIGPIGGANASFSM
jgi:hypothetical protein